MCFYSSQNKQQFISLYNINVLVFISEKCLLRGTDWIFKYNCGLYESVTVSECWGPRSILGRSMCGGQCRCGISFSSSTLVLTCQYLWFSPVSIFGSHLSVSLVLTCRYLWFSPVSIFGSHLYLSTNSSSSPSSPTCRSYRNDKRAKLGDLPNSNVRSEIREN